MKLVFVLTLALACAFAVSQAVPKETRAQKDARMKWWREARLGMFIHWGLYAIPAGKYGDQTGYGEWIRDSAHIPVGEYDKYRDEFNPVEFNADAWAKMAHDAGMKYIVITTKHHDGFNLFNSPLTDWNIGHTPFKRDIMAEMATACRKYGLKMCWYHSIMDWHHPDYLPRRPWEVANRPVDGADFRRFVKYLRDEVTWLLTHYGDIGVMWFDGEWESTWNAKDGDALYALCRQLQPNVIVNNRVTVGRGAMEDASQGGVGDFSTPEQFIPPTGLPGVDWETCMTMNDHWGYNAYDRDWKSSSQLIRNIVDIASKGGNYLLNVGPRADGTFPPEAVERLAAIGKWMKVNGDSIYDTTASVFGALPWGRSTTRVAPDGKTTTLYLQVFDWPKDGKLVIPGIGNEPIRARWLGSERDSTIHRVGSDLVLEAGPKPKDPVCTVAMVAIRGLPIVYRAPHIATPSTMLVTSTTAEIDAGSPDLEVRYTLDGSVPTLHSALYRGAIAIKNSATLKALAFHHGKAVSPLAVETFTKVSPWPAMEPGTLAAGLICREYKGACKTVADIAKLPSRAEQTRVSIGLEGSAEENWARVYEGYLQVPADGVYEFTLDSDDGSVLWIDDKVAVDNDGLHSSQTKTGLAPLAQGKHRFKLAWFNGSGNLELRVAWAISGKKAKAIDAASLFHEER